MEGAFEVRPATPEDTEQVIACVRELIRELSDDGSYELPIGAARACMRLVTGEAPGAVFIASSPGAPPAGVVTVSIQEAIRTGGPYAEIQELWVAPRARSSKVGAALIAAANEFCRTQGIEVVEVGLPPQTFRASTVHPPSTRNRTSG